MMKSLLWKDIRLNIVLLRITALVIVACYAFAAFQGKTPDFDARVHSSLICNIFFNGSVISHFLLPFSLAILSANLVASERSDGSAEFLTYLPLARKEILYSKGLLFLGVFAIATTIHFMGSLGVGWLCDIPLNDLGHFTIGFLIISAIGFGACGIGWFKYMGHLRQSFPL